MARPDATVLELKDITKGIVPADPTEIMRENPAALIVNKESYDRMGAHFSPVQFDPPQVVMVQAFDSQHGNVTKPFVLDGMTRTKFVADNAAEIEKAHPGFKFHYRNVTTSAVQNPSIVLKSERVSNQTALSMVQYLRAIIPPTVEHTQIASDRIAAHLINGWENMVGHDIAQKYSALAALSLLGLYTINIATDDALQKDLSRQVLMAEETPEDRAKLQDGLLQMGQIIRQTRLVRAEITRAAFMLVASQSEVIGGEEEARKQVYGLLHTAEVDRKLAEAFESSSQREQQRDKLSKLVFEAFAKAKEKPNASEINGTIETTLRDGVLSFEHMIQILADEDPVTKYDNAREEINFDILKNAYSRVAGTDKLTEAEAVLVESFGRKRRLSQPEVTQAVSLIKDARLTITSATQIVQNFADGREQYIAQGARDDFIDGTIAQVETIIEAIKGATTTQTLSRKTQELLEIAREANRKLNSQIATSRVGALVDEYSAEKATQDTYGRLREEIVMLVLGEFRTLDPQNQTAIVTRVRDYLSLEPDMFAAVRRGEIRLATALTRQIERRREQRPAPPAGPEAQPSAPSAPIRPYHPPVEVPTGRRLRVSPDELEAERQRREETRLRLNREKLHTLVASTLRGVREIDLSNDDLSPQDQAVIDELIRELGKLAYKHPDTPRVMRVSYPQLQQESSDRLITDVKNGLESDQKDARTGR